MARAASTRSKVVTALAPHLRGASIGIGFVILATGVRHALNDLLPTQIVFTFFYPAVLGSALLGGVSAALASLLLSIVIGGMMLHSSYGAVLPLTMLLVTLSMYVFSGAFVGAVGATLRRVLQRRREDIVRLAEREAHYRALFEGITEGFALVEGIWTEDGRLHDLRMIEANPALIRMFDISPSTLGVRHSEYAGEPMAAYFTACERAFRDGAVSLELLAEPTKRWVDLRMSRIGENKLAQIFVDITELKAAETRKTEMFDELNHRVKNNLASVSAMLSMQARASDDPKVREQLYKAVDRIETIGDVHASLYRVSSTEKVDLAAYVRRLCERLSTSLLDSDRVRLEVQTEPAMASVEESVAIGLLVNELVTNAAKYAYPPPASGVIRVSLQNRGGAMVVKVSDDGRGVPANLTSKGIGMRLVRSLVQQCHGELETDHRAGASFTIRMREHERPQREMAQSQLL